MIIPMTMQSNYMVDGVPHARVVQHLATDGQFGVLLGIQPDVPRP
jgi:hypothetical protein